MPRPPGRIRHRLPRFGRPDFRSWWRGKARQPGLRDSHSILRRESSGPFDGDTETTASHAHKQAPARATHVLTTARAINKRADTPGTPPPLADDETEQPHSADSIESEPRRRPSKPDVANIHPVEHDRPLLNLS